MINCIKLYVCRNYEQFLYIQKSTMKSSEICILTYTIFSIFQSVFDMLELLILPPEIFCVCFSNKTSLIVFIGWNIQYLKYWNILRTILKEHRGSNLVWKFSKNYEELGFWAWTNRIILDFGVGVRWKFEKICVSK